MHIPQPAVLVHRLIEFLWQIKFHFSGCSSDPIMAESSSSSKVILLAILTDIILCCVKGNKRSREASNDAASSDHDEKAKVYCLCI